MDLYRVCGQGWFAELSNESGEEPGRDYGEKAKSAWSLNEKAMGHGENGAARHFAEEFQSRGNIGGGDAPSENEFIGNIDDGKFEAQRGRGR